MNRVKSLRQITIKDVQVYFILPTMLNYCSPNIKRVRSVTSFDSSILGRVENTFTINSKNCINPFHDDPGHKLELNMFKKSYRPNIGI